MTSDATRPSGEEAPEARRPTDPEVRVVVEPLADMRRAASEFVERVSQLDAEAVRTVVQTWRDIMRRESDAWFAAERAAGQAILAAGRSAEQRPLLDRIADCVLHGVWYRGAAGQPPETPEGRVGATEASAQYAASVAMLALLVRNHLPAAQFAVLYRPFAALIPVDEFERG